MKKYLFFALLLGYFFPINAQAKHTVIVRDFEFDPADINITVGDTVMWQWESGIHTTTSEATTGADVWDEPIDNSNQTFSKVITTAGLHNYVCTPHRLGGMIGSITASGTTSAEDKINSPLEYRLNQNYPNPFNPSTTIKFQIAEPSFVLLKVYNILGNEVLTLINDRKSSGIYEVKVNASNLASGIYFYTLQAGSFLETKKMILTK